MDDGELYDLNYFDKYKDLKRKLHFLLYENQSYQDELRQAQKKLLQVTRDKNFLLERLMKYEGVSSESESDDEKFTEDKSRQGFSPAPPSFKRPNVLAMTPAHIPSSITMPSPRGVMQSPSYGSPKPAHSPTLPSPSTTFPSPAPAVSLSPKTSPRSRKASSNDNSNKAIVRKPPYALPDLTKQMNKFPIVNNEDVFCMHIENGAQCTTEISKKSKTKLCGAHRRLLNKKKKQQSAGEEMVNSPNPHTPSSTIVSSPVPQSPRPASADPAHPNMIPSPHRHMNYRPPTNPAVPPGFPPAFSQSAQHQMQQYQLQMKRMMFQQQHNPKEYYAQHYQQFQQHFQQQQQQQAQQQAQQQQVQQAQQQQVQQAQQQQVQQAQQQQVQQAQQQQVQQAQQQQVQQAQQQQVQQAQQQAQQQQQTQQQPPPQSATTDKPSEKTPAVTQAAAPAPTHQQHPPQQAPSQQPQKAQQQVPHKALQQLSQQRMVQLQRRQMQQLSEKQHSMVQHPRQGGQHIPFPPSQPFPGMIPQKLQQPVVMFETSRPQQAPKIGHVPKIEPPSETPVSASPTGDKKEGRLPLELVAALDASLEEFESSKISDLN